MVQVLSVRVWAVVRRGARVEGREGAAKEGAGPFACCTHILESREEAVAGRIDLEPVQLVRSGVNGWSGKW